MFTFIFILMFFFMFRLARANHPDWPLRASLHSAPLPAILGGRSGLSEKTPGSARSADPVVFPALPFGGAFFRANPLGAGFFRARLAVGRAGKNPFPPGPPSVGPTGPCPSAPSRFRFGFARLFPSVPHKSFPNRPRTLGWKNRLTFVKLHPDVPGPLQWNSTTVDKKINPQNTTIEYRGLDLSGFLNNPCPTTHQSHSPQ